MEIWKYLSQLSVIHFSNIQKSILANLKIPRTILCSSTLHIFIKLHLQISKYLGQFFAYPLFKYLKKHTCKSEKHRTIFCLSPFSNISKKHTCKYQNTKDSFLLIHFLNISKSILANLKIPRTIFSFSPFQIFKKT